MALFDIGQKGRNERTRQVGKRAFYATGFEKRAPQPEVWAFLHCASTSLV
jgi:hypothetical protein